MVGWPINVPVAGIVAIVHRSLGALRVAAVEPTGWLDSAGCPKRNQAELLTARRSLAVICESETRRRNGI